MTAEDFFRARDFMVGRDVHILNRRCVYGNPRKWMQQRQFCLRFHIYGCDDFTERYFADSLGIDDLPKREGAEKLPPPGEC